MMRYCRSDCPHSDAGRAIYPCSSDGEEDRERYDLRVGRTKWGRGRRKQSWQQESDRGGGSGEENEYEDSDFSKC